MKNLAPQLRIFSLALVLLYLTLSHTSAAQEVEGEAKPTVVAPDWMVMVSPTMGLLRNTTTFPVPVGRDGNDELVFEDYEMTDTGWGGGITVMGFYKRVALTNVFFGFPKVNHAKLLGSITYLSVAIPTPVFVEPYLGAGLALVSTDVDILNFNDTRIDDLGGMTMRGYAHMSWISVDNTVVAPFPKVGAKFKIPIQHWYATPFYSYMYEHVKTRARSNGGTVELWQCADQEDLSCPEITGDFPMDTVEVRAFDKTTEKNYHSHLVGADFFLDFHYFLQMRGKVYYNTNHDLWTVRLIGSMLFNENFGITAYFEYSQKITLTNTYFLIGPAFIFSQKEFKDSIREMKNRRKKGRG